MKTSREIFIELYAQDIAEYPSHYKPEIAANPMAEAVHFAENFDGMADSEIREFTNQLRRERRAIAKVS